ncbi:MAG: hypothetical protein ACREPA_07110 [Candidatus Dormibacteraceae bacterium]
MLSDAIRDIDRAVVTQERRRAEVSKGREAMRKLDVWLAHIEDMLERDSRTVPEPLMKEIGQFLRPISPKLYRSLRRNRVRDAARLLDTLFDAQEQVLPRFERTA